MQVGLTQPPGAVGAGVGAGVGAAVSFGCLREAAVEALRRSLRPELARAGPRKGNAGSIREDSEVFNVRGARGRRWYVDEMTLICPEYQIKISEQMSDIPSIRKSVQNHGLPNIFKRTDK